MPRHVVLGPTMGAPLLPRAILEQCRLRPDTVALRRVDAHAVSTTTYRQLRRQAFALAATLRATGVERGSVVAMVCDEAPGSVLAELGILLAGAAFVPLDPLSPTSRLHFQLQDCGAVVVVHSHAQSVKVEALLSAAESSPTIAAVSVEMVTGIAEGVLESEGDPSWLGHVQDADVCHIIYTSGSTGTPKGVVCGHRALAEYCAAKLATHAIDRRSSVLLAAAATWDPAVGDAFSTLAAGA